MQLLGNFQSNLTAFLYEQLLNQLESSISKGQYAGGTLFDTAAAQRIQKEGQNFSTITVPAAGNTAFAEDLNSPLDILQARYTAIANEVASLQAQIPGLLALINKESGLIDKTLAAAEVEKWGSQQPGLPTSQAFLWSFESGHGVTTNNYPGGANAFRTDPSNGVQYLPSTPDVSYVFNQGLGGDGTIKEGIGSPIIRRTIPIKTIEWQFTPNSPQSQFEEIFGEDSTWAYLASLEPSPILTFGPPNINVLLPFGGSADGLFQASGSVAGGSLPVYVRILFHPRQQQITVTAPTSGQTVTLSSYNVTANTVQVFTTTKVFVEGVDYSVDEHATLTVIPGGGLVGVTSTIMFDEFFPAYQCSIDQTNWSPIFMLDPNRPYPDDTTQFIPINIQNANFPLSDELGVPLGLFIQMVGIPTSEMVLQITTPGSQTFGENAQLVVSLQRAVFMDGLQLTPFTNFPPVIQSITAYGFTDDIQTVVLSTPLRLDRSTIIKFPRQLARKFSINLYQQNYAVKEYISEAPDALRRDTLSNLQSTLPFSVQRPPAAIPQHFEGAMYEFGIQDIAAIDDLPNVPGVFASGPYLVQGMPEVIRLDTAVDFMPQSPTPAVYLAYTAFDGNDQVLASGEVAMAPGTTILYPSGVVADHVDFFVKYVFRGSLSIAEKLKLQVTTR